MRPSDDAVVASIDVSVPTLTQSIGGVPNFKYYPVLIAGDKDSKYDDVIQLISESKKMGINRVGLATK